MAGLFYGLDVTQDYANEISVLVQEDVLENGFAVVANDLSGVYSDGFGDLYVPVKPVAATDGNIAVIASTEYYEDEAGFRSDVRDPRLVTFRKGQRVRAKRLCMNHHYFISPDLVTGVPAENKYLLLTAGSYKWTVADSIPEDTKIALKIEEINYNAMFIGLLATSGLRTRCITALAE